MLEQNDFNALTAAATARLFANMLLVAQETSPVDRLGDFEVRGRDLLMDLKAGLDAVSNETANDPYTVALCYCDVATGGYWHDPVALAVGLGLQDLTPIFDGLPKGVPEAIRDWLRDHGDHEHALAWLSEQAAALMVADAIAPTIQ